jgi:hypothetical protein
MKPAAEHKNSWWALNTGNTIRKKRPAAPEGRKGLTDSGRCSSRQ